MTSSLGGTNVFDLGRFHSHQSGFLYSLSNCAFSTVTNFRIAVFVKGKKTTQGKARGG